MDQQFKQINQNQFSKGEIESTRKLKERADIKQNIVTAIHNGNAEQLVNAIQKARYVLFDLEHKDPKIMDRQNRLHVDDGHWQRQFEKFLQEVKRNDERKDYTNNSGEIYLDGVSRIFIEVKGDEVKLIPSSVSKAEVANILALINQAFDFYYDKDKSVVSPELKAYIETNPN